MDMSITLSQLSKTYGEGPTTSEGTQAIAPI